MIDMKCIMISVMIMLRVRVYVLMMFHSKALGLEGEESWTQS